MRKTSLLCLALLIGVPIAATAQTVKPLAQTQAADVRIERASFGTFDLKSPTAFGFKQTAVVPLVVDQAYGWVMTVATDRKQVRVLEEFKLPGKPAVWNHDPSSRVGRSADGLSASSDQLMEVGPGGTVVKVWSVAAGDPKGKHTIRVWVENAPMQQFEFEVK